MDAADMDLFPQFTLTVLDDENNGVDLILSLPLRPDDRMASPALMFSLALMSLNHDGTIERRAAELLSNNPTISQQGAVEFIRLLNMETDNDRTH